MNQPLKYKGHCGSVEISVEDKCLLGKLLCIDALVSYEGQTRQDLEIAFREAVDGLISPSDPSPQPPIPQHR